MNGVEVIVFLRKSLWPRRRSQITAVHHERWTPTRVCAVTTPLRSPHVSNRQNRVDDSVTVGKPQD